jgi:hypothetical protein
MDQLFTAVAGTIIILGGAAGILWKIILPIVRKTRSLIDYLDRFTRDWFGSEEEPGRDRVPGVMERLNKLDGELSHNSGKSVKDVVDKVNKTVTGLEGTLKETTKSLKELEKRIEKVEND